MDSGREDAKRGGALLILCFVIPLLALGFWQLERAKQKTALLESMQARSAQPPLTLPAASSDRAEGGLGRDAEDLGGLTVRLRGRYDPRRQWYLDNRHYRSVVGVELITPLEDQLSGHTVLVNRGWRPISPRRVLPEAQTPEGIFELRGHIHQPDAQALVLREDRYGPPWPRLIQAIDVEEMARALGRPVFRHVVRLAPEQPGVTPANWPWVGVAPERHIGYAVTWFALAAMLALLAATRAVLSSRTRHE